MSAVLRIKSVEKIDLQADNETHLDVTVEIIQSADQPGQTDTVLEERKLNFPLDISEDDLKVELQKFIEGFNSDMELTAINMEADKAHESADKIIADLPGTVITPGQNDVSPVQPVDVMPVEQVANPTVSVETPVVNEVPAVTAEEASPQDTPSEPTEPVEPVE